MDEGECLKEEEEKLNDPSATIYMSENWDPEELQEVIWESISTQESLKQYNLELQDIVDQTFEINSALDSMTPSDQLTSEIMRESKKLMDMEVQLEKKEAEIMRELKKLMDMELQLETAGVFWGPHVNLGQLPHTPVEFADEEIQVQVLYLEEEREQEQKLDVPQEEESPVVQTKSWWRRQASRLWRGIKFVGNFCLGVMRCLGLRRCMRHVVKSNQVLPI